MNPANADHLFPIAALSAGLLGAALWSVRHVLPRPAVLRLADRRRR